MSCRGFLYGLKCNVMLWRANLYDLWTPSTPATFKANQNPKIEIEIVAVKICTELKKNRFFFFITIK
jgi:hypothetical protein